VVHVTSVLKNKYKFTLICPIQVQLAGTPMCGVENLHDF